jgi:hypothetical protein
MTDLPPPQYYRDQAVRCRKMLDATDWIADQQQLSEIAEQYDEMAEHVEELEKTHPQYSSAG